MLDGAARIKPLIEEAGKQGMPAIAVTDHGNTFGAFEFYKTATEIGIKPIIGIEAYVTPGTHRADKARVRWGSPDQNDDDVSGSGAYTHMTLLSESDEGMHNLFRLSSLRLARGLLLQAAHRPRAAADLLEGRHRDDRLPSAARCRRGCGSASTTRRRPPPRSSGTSSARTTSSPRSWTTASTSSAASMSDLLRLAKELDLPLVATNDLHYTHQHDAKSHAALLCVQSGSTLDDPKRFKFDGDGVLPQVARARCGRSSATTPRRATTRC